MKLTRLKSIFIMFGRRTFALIASIFLAAITIGIIYFSYNSVKNYIALADDGNLTIAEITDYEFKERTTRRKGRTRRHTYHTHTIVYDGYTSKIDLDKEYPNGSGLKILYSESNPSNFIISSDKPSLLDLILREIGWGYLLFIPIVMLFTVYWAWEKFDTFLDPLGERETGLKFRFPKTDLSAFRKWITHEVDEVNANGKDPMFMILMGMICSFNVKKDNCSPEELGKLNDLAMFEVGSFLFIRMSLKTEDPMEKKQIANLFTHFLNISSEALNYNSEALNTLAIHRLKSYQLLNQIDEASLKKSVAGFISESIKLSHTTLTSYISPKTSEEHSWLPQEVDRWFSHCDPMIGNLIQNKTLFKKAA